MNDIHRETTSSRKERRPRPPKSSVTVLCPLSLLLLRSLLLRRGCRSFGHRHRDCSHCATGCLRKRQDHQSGICSPVRWIVVMAVVDCRCCSSCRLRRRRRCSFFCNCSAPPSPPRSFPADVDGSSVDSFFSSSFVRNFDIVCVF